MRYVWVDAGNDPNWDKMAKHGITGIFMPMGDARTTPAMMKEIVAKGYAPGIYVGHGWYAPISPKDLVAKMSAEYKRVNVPGLRVMFNLEQKDPEYIATTLELWRAGHKYVGTSWSPEGMQGGWMGPIFVQRVVATKTRVVPQAFIGNMARVESDAVFRDLLVRGFPASSISVFYDAAQLGVGWDGYAFTMGRLP